jgi:hypothetical protein
MKEFMLFISGEGNPMAAASKEQMQQHVQKVGAYIQNLIKEGKLKSAQPLESDGVKISGSKGNFTDGPYNESKEVISGYYHILAKDLKEAIEIAKGDPRFDDGKWKIEVRPVMKVDGIN